MTRAAEASGMDGIVRYSTLTCPVCGHASRDLMPETACQYFYDCKACAGVLKPLPGDCCVYCSYGDTPCPPIQADTACCAVPAKD